MEASSEQIRPDAVQVPSWVVREDELNRVEERVAGPQMRVPFIIGFIASILAGVARRALT